MYQEFSTALKREKNILSKAPTIQELPRKKKVPFYFLFCLKEYEKEGKLCLKIQKCYKATSKRILDIIQRMLNFTSTLKRITKRLKKQQNIGKKNNNNKKNTPSNSNRIGNNVRTPIIAAELSIM